MQTLGEVQGGEGAGRGCGPPWPCVHMAMPCHAMAMPGEAPGSRDQGCLLFYLFPKVFSEHENILRILCAPQSFGTSGASHTLSSSGKRRPRRRGSGAAT